MKVGLLAFGTQGDVQPYLALGAGLVRAGHEVRLVTQEGYAARGSELGIKVFEVQGNVQEVMASPELRELLRQGNFLKINAYTSKLIQEYAMNWLRVAFDALDGCNVLLAGIGGLNPARSLSEKLQIPLIEAHVVPFTPTRNFPAPLVPVSVARLGGGANVLSHKVFQQVMWQGFRAADSKSRKEVLNLSPAPFFGSKGWQGRQPTPVLYGISQHVLPRPSDWPAHAQMTGNWLLEHAPDYQPPADLQTFLNAGPLPIYIGFGSMGNADPQQTAEIILTALERTGQRAVLLRGWGGILHDQLPSNVFLSGPVPHTWLFPRMGGVIHHGGAGTTAAALTSGVPSAVVPFFGDQPFWGERGRQLGVGPAPMPRKTLSAAQLAQAIETMSTDSDMQSKAARLGALLQQEDGVGKAVRMVESFMRP